MKRCLFFLLIFSGIFPVNAQQKPQYTQYIFNNFLINPAIAGIENYTDIKAGYRTQWTGLEGAPVTTYLSIQAPLGKNFLRGDATGFPQQGENPLGRSYTLNYRAAEPHHGVGLTLVSDKAGPITNTNLNANYAYHIGITESLNLAVGVSAGVARINLNTNELILENPLDPAITNGNNSQLKPDIGAGIWAYSSRFFVGVSAQQLFPQKLNFSDNSAYNQGRTVPHFFFTAGYKFFASDDVTLVPSVMIKQIKPVPLTFDANFKVAFRDQFWVGGSFRKDDAFAGMLGFNVGHFLNIGYSYDFTTSNLRTVSNGTHEIVLGIMLNNRYRVSCPQRLW
ncbi:MAG: type IX secretion system membrane protein PorP/SprF [Sphingobacteriaceae bacterium]